MGLSSSDRVDQLVKRILTSSTVALDSNIFIYALEENTQFPIALALFRRLPQAPSAIVTSVVSLLEASIPSYQLGDQRRVAQVVDLIVGNKITVLAVDQKTALYAAELRARFPKLKTPDALQLATALVSGAEVFVTADRDFPKHINGLRIVRI